MGAAGFEPAHRLASVSESLTSTLSLHLVRFFARSFAPAVVRLCIPPRARKTTTTTIVNQDYGGGYWLCPSLRHLILSRTLSLLKVFPAARVSLIAPPHFTTCFHRHPGFGIFAIGWRNHGESIKELSSDYRIFRLSSRLILANFSQ